MSMSAWAWRVADLRQHIRGATKDPTVCRSSSMCIKVTLQEAYAMVADAVLDFTIADGVVRVRLALVAVRKCQYGIRIPYYGRHLQGRFSHKAYSVPEISLMPVRGLRWARSLKIRVVRSMRCQLPIVVEYLFADVEQSVLCTKGLLVYSSPDARI